MSLCPKCSANIPDGELICPVCKAEIQLVPDYETLNLDLLEEENNLNKDDEAIKLREAALRAEEEKIFKRNRLKKILVILAVIAALCVTALLLWNYWQKNANKETVLTFNDYYQQALIEYNGGDYDNANGILNEALKLEPGNVDALVLQAKITYEVGNKFDAITALKTIIDNNPDAVSAYSELIEIYLADNDMDSINDLLDSSPESIKAALSDYISGAPIFSLEAGTYTEEQDVSISSTGVRIYYTTDGSNPGTTSALYTEPLHLGEGTTVLKAVSETSAGILSSVTEAQYIIDRNAPDAPAVSPASGTYYNDDNLITITIPIGCKCYYSFDSKPVAGENEYTEPVEMLEGDHIFYAMLVNDQGISGAVAAATYIYDPDYQEEDTTSYDYEEQYYTAVPTPTQAPVSTETPTPTETAEPTETEEPTETAKPTAKPTQSDTPTDEPTTEPTAEPTTKPTAEPSEEPTAEPTEEVTPEPTVEPTAEPTEEPTVEPTEEVTPEPTETVDETSVDSSSDS